MKITMLGTGRAIVTKCYNTCFLLSRENQHLLVDGGGGIGLLARLEQAGVDWRDVRDIFVTHKHIDHLLGIVWMMRMITQHINSGSYQGQARIYSHSEVIELLDRLAALLLKKNEYALIGKQLHLVTVADGESRVIQGERYTFFDIHSTKDTQYGFRLELPDGHLTCCGDEPYHPACQQWAMGSKWLLHEAFCLYNQRDIFHPYEKNHSTVRDAAINASQLQVENLLLYHTEDSDLENRRELYTAEAKQYFTGKVFVPMDLESLQL